MTDPIKPWVDSEELRRLAEALIAPPSTPSGPVAGEFGDEFVGFDEREGPAAADPPQAGGDPGPGITPPGGGVQIALEQQARETLSSARQIADRSGLLLSREQLAPPDAEEAREGRAPVLPPAQVNTPFVERLQAFGAWLRQGLRAQAFFLIDRDGGILMDEVRSPKLHQVARTLAQASRAANRQAGAAAIGSLHIKIDAERTLEVVPVTTRYGPLVLGIIVPRSVSARNIETVVRGLQQVTDGQSAP